MLARTATAPVLFSVARIDQICPPSTVLVRAARKEKKEIGVQMREPHSAGDLRRPRPDDIVDRATAGWVLPIAFRTVVRCADNARCFATLSMSFIIGGLASKVTNGNLIVLTSEPSFAKIAQTSFLTIRTSIWIAAIALLCLGALLSRTTTGRYLYAAGGNPEAARLAGVRVTGVRSVSFAASGTRAALAGVIDTSRVLRAQSSSGATLAFTVLAGIVVGGTSILGGDG